MARTAESEDSVIAYSSWSVVFSEQPSAAKWNILGTNDASFNDGTGIADGAIGPAKRSGGFFVSNFTITAAATGAKVITGVGFAPSAVIFLTAGQASASLFQLSIGATDGTNQYVIAGRGAEGGDISGADVATLVISTLGANAAADTTASITSLDADGFTLNVVAAGSTTVVGYLAVR